MSDIWPCIYPILRSSVELKVKILMSLSFREEPKMPYLVITDGQQYLERRERKNPPKNFMK